MVTIPVPMWVIVLGILYVITNALANALDPRDKSFYGTMSRFVKGLALNMPSFAEQEFHVKLPTLPTQAGQELNSSEPASSTQN
jgi:hypothetical protein